MWEYETLSGEIDSPKHNPEKKEVARQWERRAEEGEHRVWAFRIERVQVALDRVTGDRSEEDVQKCPQKVIFGERFIRFAQTRILTLRLNEIHHAEGYDERFPQREKNRRQDTLNEYTQKARGIT